ncbi:hypothetical protein SteCoe_10307 [Stentor coeruleus]|uniref:Protein kinase domain-containing protein n=1 Tax=Stentor coeruleus TaxID=5963 RepID=A0A1R2CG11_9CILI|nr:hypothetical protein SteCoe_10307 [Stentor coeruleus]
MTSYISFSYSSKPESSQTRGRSKKSHIISFKHNSKLKHFTRLTTTASFFPTASQRASSSIRHSSKNSSKIPLQISNSKGIYNNSILTCEISRKNSLPDNLTDFPNLFPITSKAALLKYPNLLTDYEKEEMKYYSLIYFLAPSCIKAGSLFLLDDEDGNYRALQGDHLVFRYEVFHTLGKGSFAMTYKCFDHKHKQFVAVKIIKNIKRLESQSEIEVRLLKKIKMHNSKNEYGIVNILDNFKFRGHPCIVFELLDLSILQHLKLNNHRSYPIEVVKSYTRCLLKSLSFLKSHSIIHSDLKPANILLSNNPAVPLKIIDFGTSCSSKEIVYKYIQSRYYRAPEVMMGLDYDEAIDMWSLGCVLYELVTGSILFKGDTEAEVLSQVCFIRGKPPSELKARAQRNLSFNGEKKSTFEYKIHDKNLIDFLERCLNWDPRLRLKPEDGLLHAWLREF